MFGGYTGRSREESLGLLKEFLGAYGPPERALKSLRGPMPQHQLAAESGVSQPLISGIEAGTKDLTPGVAGSIADALGVPQGALQTAVKLGRLKAALEGGQTNGTPLTLQIVEVLALVEEYIPEGELRLQLREVLTGALVEAAQRDRARLKELEAKESASPPQVATKNRKRSPDRDAHGRRIHKPTTEPIRGDELLGLSTKGKKADGIERDAFGRNRANRRP